MVPTDGRVDKKGVTSLLSKATMKHTPGSSLNGCPMKPAKIRQRINQLTAKIAALEESVTKADRKLRVLRSRSVGGHSRKDKILALTRLRRNLASHRLKFEEGELSSIFFLGGYIGKDTIDGEDYVPPAVRRRSRQSQSTGDHTLISRSAVFRAATSSLDTIPETDPSHNIYNGLVTGK